LPPDLRAPRRLDAFPHGPRDPAPEAVPRGGEPRLERDLARRIRRRPARPRADPRADRRGAAHARRARRRGARLRAPAVARAHGRAVRATRRRPAPAPAPARRRGPRALAAVRGEPVEGPERLLGPPAESLSATPGRGALGLGLRLARRSPRRA